MAIRLDQYNNQLYVSDTVTANAPLVLQPQGTGALQAQLTDSTATGGNARGANAIDLQTYTRSSAAQVASGLASNVLGGARNTASGTACTVSGGTDNVASAANGFIGGGGTNAANVFFSAVVAGYSNTAGGVYNLIGAGYANSGTSGSVVTTQSGTMNGTTAVTLSGSNASIKVGQYVSGTSISQDTYVAAISGTSLTLSRVATGSSTSTLSFYTPHGVVVGGGNNTATGSYSFIGGGGDAGTASGRNTASGAWSSVVGGTRNTASGIASFVGGGGADGIGNYYGNVASGTLSVIGGGWNNQATNSWASILGGQSNVSSGPYSVVTGGSENVNNSTYGVVNGGQYGTTRSITGLNVSPASTSPISGTLGISQSALLVLARQTTDATPTVLRSDSNAASTTNQVILPNNSAYFFTGEVVAGVTGGGNTKGWTIEGVIKRGANAASTALVGTPTVTSTYADAGASTWVIAVTADTTNGGLAVTFTGQAATTIRTVAKISTVEMTF